MEKASKLEMLRRCISAIDKKIMRALNERLELAEQIGEYKRIHELPVEDPHLEMRKRRDRIAFLHTLSHENARDIEIIFRSIIQVSRSVQRKDITIKSSAKGTRRVNQATTRIAVMGSLGSFTEEAGISYCKKNDIKNYSLLYPVSAEGVLHLLDIEQADIGIFPIFNSNAGIVYESIYAASEHIFSIDDIFAIDIRQCLMTLPGVNKSQIKAIMSHPQALAQCKGYIKKEFPNAKLIEGSDTATSAQYLGENRTQKTLAVIAPKKCASLYKLALLEEGIQDLKNNLTYFIAAMM